MAVTGAAARSDTPPNAWCGLRFGQPSSDDPAEVSDVFDIAPPIPAHYSEAPARRGGPAIRRLFISGVCVSTVSIVSACRRTCPTEQLAGQWAGSCPRKRQISIAGGFCSEPGSGNADGTDGADGTGGTFECARILMILLPSRPPRLNVMLMPKTRRKLCARRRRPAIARGFWGQPVLSLNIPSTPRSAPARKRSAALPIHELRSAMISRTQAATGSASIMPSIAALRFAS
jgi:hypothetical protein